MTTGGYLKDSPEKIQWHPAFAAAMGLEFKNDYEYVRIEQEHNLSKEPLRIDLLVLKVNNTERKFSNEIGHIMKTYNIIEYKSPKDSLNIDDYYKTIAYACLYKGLEDSVDNIPANEITVSLVCTSRPVKTFNRLKEDGAIIEQKFPGIYYITGDTLFPVQIVVVKELDKQNHSSLRVLTDKADREDVEMFLKNSIGANENWEKSDIDAILQASVSANKELYKAIRRDSGMCQALRELMKDEIDKEIEGAESRGEKRGERRGERRGEKRGEANLISNMYNNGVTPEQISNMTNMKLDKVNRIIYGNKPVKV